MYNFFVNSNQIENDKIYIIDGDAKHISQVLRMKKGEKIFICNKENENRYLAEISNIEKDKVICTILQNEETTEPSIQITLFQGLPKSDKMEMIIQKATELGVSEIIPVEMKNCIVKIKDEDKKISRWQTIAESASKQSKRTIIPKINKVEKIKNIKEKIQDYDLVLFAYENEKNNSLKKILRNNKKISKIAIIIGPEGGFDKEEAKELEELGAKGVTLGKTILRTETASIAMISMIMYEFELQ